MKILVFNGSPRDNGVTVHLLEAFMLKAVELGHDVARYDLDRINLHPCRACDSCKTTGHCVLKDEFQTISQDIKKADGIVFAAPVFWNSLPSQMKTLLDRFFSFQADKFKIGEKKVGYISVNGDKDVDSFKGFTLSLDMTCELLGWKKVGEVLITDVSENFTVIDRNYLEKATVLAEKF